jgi:hypothetical protein
MNGAHVTLRRQVGSATYWVSQNVYTARLVPMLDIYFDAANCSGDAWISVRDGSAPGFAVGSYAGASNAYLVQATQFRFTALSRLRAADGSCEASTSITDDFLRVVVDTTLIATPLPFTLEPQ